MELYSNNGSVWLTNVTVSNNLDGSYGAYIVASNDISISGGDFSGNSDEGLHIESGGNIWVTGVTANNSDSDSGLHINQAVDVVITNSTFNNNADSGLDITSGGNVTLTNVTANGNQGDGVDIYGNTGSFPTPYNTTINGGNFNDNRYYGLNIWNRTGGDVTLSNVTALRNGGLPFGSSGILGNDSAYSGALVQVGGAGNINVVCGNYSDNGAYGLELYTNTGNANVNGATLVGNGYGEVYFESLGGGAILFGKCGGQDDGPHGFKAQNNLVPPTSSAAQVCDGEKKVVLKAGEAFGAYENLCDVEFQLKDVAEDALPGALPSGATQLGSLEAQVTSGGNALGELPVGGKITLKFPVPAGTDASTLVVLFWNGTAWVEVSGGTVVDGFYVVTVEKPGNYVLAGCRRALKSCL